MAVNFLVAGKCLLSRMHYAPAVAIFYTSAYHSLHAFLALNGRVIFDPVWWENDDPNNTQAIISILKSNNKWQFEPRKRSHSQRWKELTQIFSPSNEVIPSYYQHLFEHLYRGRMKKSNTPFIEYLRDPISNSITLRDALPDFLNDIAKIRHSSLYEGLGIDPGLYDALANRDCISETGYPERTNALEQFAYSSCEDVALQTLEIISGLTLNLELHKKIWLRIVYPWMDEPQMNDFADCKLKDVLHRIQELISLSNYH